MGSSGGKPFYPTTGKYLNNKNIKIKIKLKINHIFNKYIKKINKKKYFINDLNLYIFYINLSYHYFFK